MPSIDFRQPTPGIATAARGFLSGGRPGNAQGGGDCCCGGGVMDYAMNPFYFLNSDQREELGG